jgi:hypothetical protein
MLKRQVNQEVNTALWFDQRLPGPSLSPKANYKYWHTMAATAKSLETQQTFNSTDDLLEASDNDVEGGSNDGPTTTTTRGRLVDYYSAVWDCKAVHWPPHSFTTIVRAGCEYAQSLLILEVLFLGVFVLLCAILPG